VGTYGTLSLNALTGAYTYVANATAINALTGTDKDNFNLAVSDGTATANQTLVINISGANDTPTLTAVTAASLTDTVANDTFASIAGSLVGADRDTAQTLTYGISGATVNSGLSTIVGTYGTLTLNNNTGAYNYKPNDIAINALTGNASDSFNFTVNDGTLTANQPFVVNIAGANDPPTLAAVIASSYIDTASNDSFSNTTGTLAGVDRDTAQTLTYGITGSTVAGGLATLVGTYGTLSLNTASGAYTYIPDATKVNAVSSNATDSFVFTISDGTLTTNQPFAINITGANDTPILAAVAAGNYLDTAAADTFVNITGNLVGTDRDTNQTLSYSINGGTITTDTSSLVGTYGKLSLNIASGAYTYVPDAVKINALTTNTTDNFTFVFGDGITTANQTFAVNLTAANDTPTQLAIDNTSIAENSPIGTLVGKLSSTDPDTSDSFTYSIAPNDIFSITGNELKLTASPDFETKASYQISVKTTDKAGLSLEKPFTINITNIAEPTVVKNPSDKTLQFTSEKSSNNLSFQITSPNPSNFSEIGFFKVDDNLGSIKGIKPGEPGYLAAARDRFQSILAQLPSGDLPQGFDGKTSRSLNLNNNDIIRFGVLNGATLDKLTEPTTVSTNNSGETTINWPAPLNLNATIKVDNAPAILGTATQSKPEGEFFDFRQSTQDISATFSVYREASYNNNVYIYAIQDESGTVIDTATNQTFKPTDSGYIQAALRNAVVNVNLSTPNQTTTTSTAVLAKGSLFAPIIVVNGSKDALLDNNAGNDPAAYTVFKLGNADKFDHVKLLGDNTFGFEDLPGSSGADYNDIIVQGSFKPVV
jgi:VCBS repeat-containing protein